MRFPLNQQLLGGYDYGKPTNYSPKHLGVDWRARYVNLYAPKDGEIVKTIHASTALDGGNTMWFKPKGENVIIRWLHLSKFVRRSGSVTEGELLAITGNTGRSDIPHLHEDLWKNGKVTLNFKDTINPHTYYKQTINLTTMKLVKDNGTVYLVTGNKDKRKIGIADEIALGLFGDETQEEMDTSKIPQFNTIASNGIVISSN